MPLGKSHMKKYIIHFSKVGMSNALLTPMRESPLQKQKVMALLCIIMDNAQLGFESELRINITFKLGGEV